MLQPPLGPSLDMVPTPEQSRLTYSNNWKTWKCFGYHCWTFGQYLLTHMNVSFAMQCTTLIQFCENFQYLEIHGFLEMIEKCVRF